MTDVSTYHAVHSTAFGANLCFPLELRVPQCSASGICWLADVKRAGSEVTDEEPL